MMNIDEIKCNISHLLEDRGLTGEYKEQAVRLLLYHLYVAMDIYRYMTSSEKNKAGFWYRTFKSSYRLTGFLKERKRKRDKEKSPLHPSYKERETEVKEKEEKQTEQNTATGDAVLEGFRKECLRHVGQYGQELVEDFYYHWKQVDKKTGKRLFEGKRCFDIDSQLRAWSKSEYTLSKETAALRLERAKGKDGGKQQAANTADQQAIAAKREEDNEKLEREIAERKQGAVSYEEYLKMKAAIKREQNQACLGFAEREQARCETSRVIRGDGNTHNDT